MLGKVVDQGSRGPRTPYCADHEFRHNIVKVAHVDPRGDSRVDPQTTLTML